MYTRKHFNFVRTALMLFFALFVSSNAWAIAPTVTINNYEFEKDGNDNILIQSADDWNALAEAVAAGNSCTGLTFLMTTDIGTVTKPLGKQIDNKTPATRNRFAGTFDGGGHTLTVGLNSNDEWFSHKREYCAPFAYTQDVTIKNLRVNGSITSISKNASGLIGNSDGTCTIKNCQVSATITSTLNNDAVRDGGFVGLAESSSTISISDSWFDGEFAVGGSGKLGQSGGFIGNNNGTATFTNCLFNPSSISGDTNGSVQFAYAPTSSGKIINSSNYYYVTALGNDAQGGTPVDYAFYDNAVNTLTNADNKDVLLWGRTLKKDGYWNTLCLPFGVEDGDANDGISFTGTPLQGATVMELDAANSGLNGNTLTLNFIDATSIVAGKPYIVKWTSGDPLVNPFFTGVTINEAAPTAVNFTGGKFVGQYSPFTVDNANEIIYVGSNDKIGYAAQNKKLRAFRAHFDMSQPVYSAPVMNIVFNTEDGQTTAINTVNGSEFKDNGEYYNLAGQRVAQPTKGLYIVNGKKMFVK